jgi:hypothetical protein
MELRASGASRRRGDKVIRQTNRVQVSLAPDGFRPWSFRWQGRVVRVLSVESVRTLGTERRYLVRTAGGNFELGWYTEAGVWVVRRSPSWLDRVWVEWRNTPRYPLPAWRRRVRKGGTGGDHADWFTLVR